MTKPIEIYFEQTPNPESLKFVTNQILIPNITLENKRGEDYSDFPLAESIFEKFEFISIVFVSNNFVSITKSTNAEWYEIMHDIKDYLIMYLQNNFEIVSKSFIDKQIKSHTDTLNEDTTESKIIDLLEKYVKPAVEKDGGNIAFKSFDDGIVTLKMQGSCSGCPSSQITLKSGIEGLLKRMVPEVLEVVAEAG